MVAAVDRHGFAETTLGELVALAGVSKSTFYDHFASKQECFLATFESIVREASRRVASAYRMGLGLEERLTAAFSEFAEIVARDHAAASLVIVESLSLGSEGLEQRQMAFEPFERMIHQSFAEEPDELRPSDLAVRVLVAGIWTVVYRCIRDGVPDRLADHFEPLMEWVLSYRSSAAPEPLRPRRTPPTLEGLSQPLEWAEPADSPRSRDLLSQRERIVRATAQVVSRQGFASLTIPAISAAAGTSNQTFYEHFKSKDEAFIAAFEELSVEAIATAFNSVHGVGDWQGRIEVGYRALFEHLEREPLFRRIAFFELPAAGATALDHADAAIRRFTMFLRPGAIPGGLRPLPPVVIEAMGGGLWSAIQRQMVSDGLASPADFAARLAEVTVTPMVAG